MYAQNGCPEPERGGAYRFIRDCMTLWAMWCFGTVMATLCMAVLAALVIALLASVETLVGGATPAWFYRLVSWIVP